MGSNTSTQRVQAERVEVDQSCPLCRGLRPREWPANSTRSFVGESIDLYWFPKDIVILQDPNQTCSFCCFIRAIIDHLCREGNHEWPTTVPVKGNPISDSNGKFSGYYNLSIELRPEYPLRNRDIDVFLDDPGKQLPWLEIKHLPPSPLRDLSSDAAVQWAKLGLHKCQKKHKLCKPAKEIKLPKRILDLFQYPTVRLLETSGQENKKYACLSYLWREEGQDPTTQTGNLATRVEKGIEYDQLPKLLQEAITFVHRLGIRYLWVASLCIQQDNQDDRQEHSSQMGAIFSNAHITIAAARAENVSQSLFSNGETSLTYNDIPFILREKPRHPTKYNSSLNMFPLLGRAWAAQEILLSRRVLYVCEGILTYECIEQGSSWSCTCTDDPRDEHRSPGLKDPLMNVSLFAEPFANNRFGPWWQVIQYYTKRDLCDEKDRLPALSNIARRFAEQRRNDPITYAAGLWAEDLPAGLLWHHSYNHSPKPRNSESTAPSWSWASTIGQVSSPAGHPSSDLYYVSVVSVECIPLSIDDRYGQLQSAKLVLTGSCLLPFDLWHRPGSRHYKAVHDGKGGINVLPEIEMEYRNDGWHAGGQGVEYYGLPMVRTSSEIRDVGGSSLGYTVAGLVLRRLKGSGQETENENEFERVAFWESGSEKGYWKKGEDEWSGERLDRLLDGKQGEKVVIL